MTADIATLLLRDDGLVPNNPVLPVRLYRGAFSAAVAEADAAGLIAAHFDRNGWAGSWVGSVYRYHHYHARAHEVLGVAAGAATLQLGGADGAVVPVAAGDAVLIPAGVGHKLVSGSGDFTVVGAYPAGQEAYDLKRATRANRAIALVEIPLVARPRRDPVLGRAPPWPVRR